jgi:hypothetical protein
MKQLKHDSRLIHRFRIMGGTKIFASGSFRWPKKMLRVGEYVDCRLWSWLRTTQYNLSKVSNLFYPKRALSKEPYLQ